MGIFIQDIRLIGTAYIYASCIEEAKKCLAALYPICVDVTDRAWFTSSDRIFISSGLTIETLVENQSPLQVTRRAMNESMRSSVRGKKSFWLPARDLRKLQTMVDIYCVDIDLIGTAFVEAGDAARARQHLERNHGKTIDVDRDSCFDAFGLLDEDWQIALSPMLSIVGSREHNSIQLEIEGHDDGCVLNVSNPVASLSYAADEAYGRTSFYKEETIEIAAERLKSIFEEWGPGSLETDDDTALELARVMREVLDRRSLAVPHRGS